MTIGEALIKSINELNVISDAIRKTDYIHSINISLIATRVGICAASLSLGHKECDDILLKNDPHEKQPTMWPELREKEKV
jgi:hypothetical protein